MERALIDGALRRHHGDVEAVSSELGVDSSTLYRKMRGHDIALASYRDDAAAPAGKGASAGAGKTG